MWLFCVERLTKKQVLLYASFRVINVTLVVLQMFGLYVQMHCKAAGRNSNDDLKKVA